MKFIDLNIQYNLIAKKIKKRIDNVLRSGQFILGDEVKLLEQKLASFVGAKHCISCSSGTDALVISLMSQDIGPGDAVFTTPFTYIATSESIRLVGATPIFVDIDSNTFNIDPNKLIEKIHFIKKDKKLKPKAIIPVNIFGVTSDYEVINLIANENNLFVLEDAAQSFGAVYNGKKSCNLGDISATSFFPAKPLGCYGDGGAIFTNDDSIVNKIKSIRVHGSGTNKYDNVRNGINGRLDTLQAAILLEKLKIFPDELKKRNDIAEKYTNYLYPTFKIQKVPLNSISSYAQYSFLCKTMEDRDKLENLLSKNNIPSAIYYKIPLHLQKVNIDLNYRIGSLPITENVCNRIISIPMYPYLKNSQIDFIAEVILD